jgi:Tol biopolymer transport system component
VGTHDVGEREGVFYIVSELVPGETLGAVMERGPLPLKKLLDLAAQIADGMAAAHAARITHRDLKPPNIIVTPDGRAKILDFGLAKQATLPAASPDETMTVQQTEPGMILGTVAYMSPEQVRGNPADHRSDQFSFGLILYEMAAGRKAFQKPESVQTMSAILTEDAPPIERDIPAPLRWTIDRCLAKDPADRFESSRDLYQELRHIREHLSQTTGATPAAAAAPAKVRRPIRWVFPIVGTIGLIGAFAIGRYLAGPSFPDQSAYRYTPFAFDPGGQWLPYWSPDGKAIAYAGRIGGPYGRVQVFVRYLDSPLPQQVTRIVEDAAPLGWAPDSKRILFSSHRAPAGIWSISVAGGEPESFYAVDAGRPVAVAPDLSAVAVLRRGEDQNYGVWISAPPGAPAKKYPGDPTTTRVVYNQPRLRFSPDGKNILVYVAGDRVREQAWLLPYPGSDSRPPKPVLADFPNAGGTPLFDWMPDSRRIVLSRTTASEAAPQLWLADPLSNTIMALTSGTASRGSFAISPDGARIVFAEQTGSYDVVSVDLASATAKPLIATDRAEMMPAWAGKEHTLAYVTDRGGSYEIWLHSAKGPDRPIVTSRDFPGGTQWFMAPALSPDGERVIYSHLAGDGGGRLWMSSVSGGAPVQVTNEAQSVEFPGSWSPDGSWFVYLAMRNGNVHLMKVKTSGQAAPAVVKAEKGCETPSWSPASDLILCGHELISPDGQTVRTLAERPTQNYVFSQDGKLLYGLRDEQERETLFSVDVATGAEKTIGTLGSEFRPASNVRPAIRFSLAPDGKSFIYSAGVFRSNLWMLTGALKP